MDTFNKEYWDKRYENSETGWDIGYVSLPLKEYIDTLTDRDIRILIPGGGNAYEAEYLHNNGFWNVYLLDISPAPLQNFIQRVPGFPQKHLTCNDFFQYNAYGQFDLVLEQTFFCALHPSLREEYAKQMFRLLKPGGRLVGVLFNDKLNDDKPPFGGNKEEYRKLFEKYFLIEHLETCYNSITPRMGRELFISFIKRKTKKSEANTSQQQAEVSTNTDFPLGDAIADILDIISDMD